MQLLVVILVLVAFVLVHILIGGGRLLYGLPSYGLIGIAALIAWRPIARARPVLSWRCLAATLLFAAFLLIRNIFSPFSYLARWDFFLLLGSLVIYLLVALWIDRTKARFWFFFGMLVMALAHLVIAAIQFNRGDQFMPIDWLQRTDDSWRASGFFISSNHFAGFLEVVILMGLGLIVWGSIGGLMKMMLGYALIACVAGVAVSGSRGGYLSVAFGALSFVGLSLFASRSTSKGPILKRSLLAIAALIMVLGLAVFSMFRSDTLRARFYSINDPENMRLLLWDSALSQFQLSPLWGTGSGTFLYFGRMFRHPAVQNDPIWVHNDYLHLLAEYGIIGAVLFALFLVCHLVFGIRSLRRMAEQNAARGDRCSNELGLYIGALSVVAAYIIHSIVDFNLHIPANALGMAVVFGVICAPGVGKLSQLPRWGDRILRSAHISLLVAAVGLVVYGGMIFRGEYLAELARSALRDYQLEKARSLAQAALSSEKRNPDLFYYAGEAARELGARDPDPSRANQLGEEAVQMFRAGLQVFPHDVRITMKLGQALGQLKRFDEGEVELKRALELDPKFSTVHAYFGLHFHAQDRLKEAAAHYQRALELDSKNPMAVSGYLQVKQRLEPPSKNQPTPVPIFELTKEEEEWELAKEKELAAERAARKKEVEEWRRK